MMDDDESTIQCLSLDERLAHKVIHFMLLQDRKPLTFNYLHYSVVESTFNGI